MIKTKMTMHAKTDRLDRLAACVRYLGVGEIILETTHNKAKTLIWYKKSSENGERSLWLTGILESFASLPFQDV